LYTVGKGRILIGSNTSIRYNSRIGSAESVSIGNNVIISNNVTIMDNNNHPIHPKDRLRMIASGYGSNLWSWNFSRAKAIVIGDNIWIGEQVRICKGVTIGEGSVVAANSVVTHDVPAFSMVAGNPARIVKSDIDSTDQIFGNDQ